MVGPRPYIRCLLVVFCLVSHIRISFNLPWSKIFHYMARLSILKTDHSHNRLQVEWQHYRLIMIENIFDIVLLKNWRILRYIKIGYNSLLFICRYKTFMMKVKWITKSTKKTWTSSAILLQTTNRKTKNKIRQSNLVKLCGKKNKQGEVKYLTFQWLNLPLMFIFEEVKKKDGEMYKPKTLKAFQPSIHKHFKRIQRQICWMKTSLNFLYKFSNAEESSCWSNVRKEIIFGTRSVPYRRIMLGSYFWKLLKTMARKEN